MSAGKPRLLIVDDEPDMLDFLERVFRSEFAVTRCSSAEEALAQLRGEQGESFKVLITDQKMPRMTGVELLEQIRESHPRLVKLLLSGFTELPEIQRAIERCGIAAYVVKPVDADRLKEAVRTVMLD